jgi:hypothetical protein
MAITFQLSFIQLAWMQYLYNVFRMIIAWGVSSHHIICLCVQEENVDSTNGKNRHGLTFFFGSMLSRCDQQYKVYVIFILLILESKRGRKFIVEMLKMAAQYKTYYCCILNIWHLT